LTFGVATHIIRDIVTSEFRLRSRPARVVVTLDPALFLCPGEPLPGAPISPGQYRRMMNELDQEIGGDGEE
jgi:hypothetical protein